jgi:hypothetical protein
LVREKARICQQPLVKLLRQQVDHIRVWN